MGLKNAASRFVTRHHKQLHPTHPKQQPQHCPTHPATSRTLACHKKTKLYRPSLTQPWPKQKQPKRRCKKRNPSVVSWVDCFAGPRPKKKTATPRAATRSVIVPLLPRAVPMMPLPEKMYRKCTRKQLLPSLVTIRRLSRRNPKRRLNLLPVKRLLRVHRVTVGLIL